MEENRPLNLDLWNEWTDINAQSALYRLEEFKHGENKLNQLEREEVGDVNGRSLLHFQCHFGMDTLSWARLGAQVTGVDFSDRAIQLARELSRETGIPGRFICCDLYDLPKHLEEQFDIIYTSYGVLTWLSDLTRWAGLIDRYLKPGGLFYIAEFHPFALMFDEDAPEPRLLYPYFAKDVIVCPIQGSYSDKDAPMKTKESYEWQHTMGEIITVLCQAGLRIEFLHEHPFSVYQQLAFLQPNAEHNYALPPDMVDFPLMYSIRARKPA